MHTSPRCLPLLAVILVSVARLALAQEEIGPQKDLPSPDKIAWEVPCNLNLPLEPLLAQGLLTFQHQERGATKPSLELLNMDTGKVVWKIELSGGVEAINASKDTIFVCLSDRVAGVRVADGKVLWQQKLEARGDSGWQTPPTFQQIQWFADFRTMGQGIGGVLFWMKDMVCVKAGDCIYALNAQTGAELWEQQAGALAFPLVGIGDTIFVTTMFQGVAALNAANGNILWHTTDVGKCDPIFVFGDEKAPEFYGASDKGFVRFDPKTGKVLWLAEMKRGSEALVRSCGDRLAILMADQAWVLDKADGAKAWGAATAHQQSAYANGRIILRGDKGGDIYCYSIAAGDYVWHVPCPGNNVARLFVGGDVVVAVDHSQITAYDVPKGAELWRRIATPMQGFEASTWASNDKAIFYRTMNWVFGCDPQRGSWVTAVPGQFFFVHWMWTRGDAVFMHNGEPGGPKLQAIIVKAKVKPEGE